MPVIVTTTPAEPIQTELGEAETAVGRLTTPNDLAEGDTHASSGAGCECVSVNELTEAPSCALDTVVMARRQRVYAYPAPTVTAASQSLDAGVNCEPGFIVTTVYCLSLIHI